MKPNGTRPKASKGVLPLDGRIQLSRDNPPGKVGWEGGEEVVPWRLKETYFENCPCDTQNVLSKIWAFLLVSRAEFMVMGIPVVAVPALLAASRPNDLMGDGAVRLGLVTAVWYLAYCIASQVNCLADYELDKPYKSRLPRSIDILKGPRTIWLITVESVVAVPRSWGTWQNPNLVSGSLCCG